MKRFDYRRQFKNLTKEELEIEEAHYLDKSLCVFDEDLERELHKIVTYIRSRIAKLAS